MGNIGGWLTDSAVIKRSLPTGDLSLGSANAVSSLPDRLREHAGLHSDSKDLLLEAAAALEWLG